jgi:hypothetical protein
METEKDLSIQQVYLPLNTISFSEQAQSLPGTTGALPLPEPNQNVKRPKGKDKGLGKRK